MVLKRGGYHFRTHAGVSLAGPQQGLGFREFTHWLLGDEEIICTKPLNPKPRYIYIYTYLFIDMVLGFRGFRGHKSE